MTSSRQSSTWVASAIGPSRPSSKYMQPGAAGTGSAAETEGSSRVFIAVLLATVARRVEPPLGAEAEEMLQRSERVDVVLRVEHPRALASGGEHVDQPELRAAVVTPPRGREEGDDAEPEQARAEGPRRVRRFAVHAGERDHAPLHRLIGPLERDAPDLAGEEVGADGEDALVTVAEIEITAGVAEGPDIGADHHPEQAGLPVAAERGRELVGALRGPVGVELVRGGEIAVRGEPRGIAEEDVHVGVAFPCEGADLRAEDVAAIRGQRVEDARLGLALAGGDAVRL